MSKHLIICPHPSERWCHPFHQGLMPAAGHSVHLVEHWSKTCGGGGH